MMAGIDSSTCSSMLDQSHAYRDVTKEMKIASDSGLQIVTTPTLQWLSENAKSCRSRMLIASPYVNNGVIQITDLAPERVTRTLITRTDLRDFATGASNLETLCTLARNGVGVSSLSGLHAKMYIFDDTCALVTSANATNSGMCHNIECGLGTRDSKVVAQLARTLLRGFGSEVPRGMTLTALEGLREALPAIRVSVPQHSPTPVPADTEHDLQPVFSVTDDAHFLGNYILVYQTRS